MASRPSAATPKEPPLGLARHSARSAGAARTAGCRARRRPGSRPGPTGITGLLAGMDSLEGRPVPPRDLHKLHAVLNLLADKSPQPGSSADVLLRVAGASVAV